MDDMNAKELFRKKVTEADEPRPGGPPPGRPLKLSGRMRTVPYHPPGSEMGEEDLPSEDIARMTGQAAPKGQFNPKELSQLKDVLIMILASLAHSDLDMAIGQALMSGQELDPGQLQHILDEARNIQVPDSHGPLLQKIFDRLSRS
jgi:hypothetical protein